MNDSVRAHSHRREREASNHCPSRVNTRHAVPHAAPCFPICGLVIQHSAHHIYKHKPSGDSLRGLERACAQLQGSSFKQALLLNHMDGEACTQTNVAAASRPTAQPCVHGSAYKRSHARPSSMAAHLRGVELRSHDEINTTSWQHGGDSGHAFDRRARLNLYELSSLLLHPARNKTCGGHGLEQQHERRQSSVEELHGGTPCTQYVRRMREQCA